MGFKKIAAAFFVFFIGSIAFGESLTARLEPAEGNVGDEFFLIITASGSIDGEIRVPAVPGLELVRSGTSMNSISINGKLTQTTEYQYSIQADKPGKYAIPPIQLEINGKIQATKELQLIVRSGGTSREVLQIQLQTLVTNRSLRLS